MKDGDDWLDFKAIKESADVRLVLSHFGLLEHLEERGPEWVGWCPFGEEHGKKDSFSVNVEKKAFQCFACKAHGSVLDLVAKLQNGTLREAAQTTLSIMGGGEGHEETRGGRPYGNGKGARAAREVVPEASGPARPISQGDRGTESPAVMSFSLASRLIIAKKMNPDNLLVVDMRAAGVQWVKSKKE